MGLGFGLGLWSSPEWRGLAVAWVDEQFRAAGIARAGDVTQPHLRPWGTVLRVPSDAGVFWLKAPGPQTLFEIDLYRLFPVVCPDRTLNPLACDAEQGWMLLPDGGAVLGDRADAGALVEALVRIMPRYAALQRDLAPHVEKLLDVGVADMRPARMPERFDEALAVVGAYAERHGKPADHTMLAKVAAMRGTVRGWCDELATSPVPHSLDHGDLHAWNIFSSAASRNGSATFYDWGDSVVGHPFASMLVGLGFLRQFLGVRDNNAAVLRVRDAYLGAFADQADRGRLVRDLELACQVAKVARVLTWDRSLRAQGYELAGDFGRAPLRSLTALLRKSPLQLGA